MGKLSVSLVVMQRAAEAPRGKQGWQWFAIREAIAKHGAIVHASMEAQNDKLQRTLFQA